MPTESATRPSTRENLIFDVLTGVRVCDVIVQGPRVTFEGAPRARSRGEGGRRRRGKTPSRCWTQAELAWGSPCQARSCGPWPRTRTSPRSSSPLMIPPVSVRGLRRPATSPRPDPRARRASFVVPTKPEISSTSSTRPSVTASIRERYDGLQADLGRGRIADGVAYRRYARTAAIYTVRFGSSCRRSRSRCTPPIRSPYRGVRRCSYLLPVLSQQPVQLAQMTGALPELDELELEPLLLLDPDELEPAPLLLLDPDELEPAPLLLELELDERPPLELLELEPAPLLLLASLTAATPAPPLLDDDVLEPKAAAAARRRGQSRANRCWSHAVRSAEALSIELRPPVAHARRRAGRKEHSTAHVGDTPPASPSKGDPHAPSTNGMEDANGQ